MSPIKSRNPLIVPVGIWCPGSHAVEEAGFAPRSSLSSLLQTSQLQFCKELAFVFEEGIIILISQSFSSNTKFLIHKALV